jgi:hypothetical protein
MPPATPSIPQDGLRLCDALREYGPPAVVAELDRVLDTLRDLQGFNFKPAKADVEGDAEKLRRRLWEDLRGKLVAENLFLTWQPSDPTADRKRLAANRCSGLQARITIDGVEDRVFLAGHALEDVLIHWVQTAASPNRHARQRPKRKGERLVEAFLARHEKGDDILSPVSVQELHVRVVKEAGVGQVNNRTIERAHRDARLRLLNC